MVTSIARQSVIIKCNMQASIMLGNYEFFYAAGLFCKIRGISVETDILPKALEELIKPELKTFESEDKREQHLVKMLSNYEVSEEYDEQMKELLEWGLGEADIWQVTVSR